MAWLLLVAAVLVVDPAPVWAQKKYSPEHPEVREMVQKGVALMRNRMDGDFGGQVLQGLAILNTYEDTGFLEDAQVQRAVNTVVSKIPEFREVLENDMAGHDIKTRPEEEVFRRMYESGVALMLLVEFDDKKYEEEIRVLIEFIVRRQMPSGGWGYNLTPSGDTSQAQYCCLGLWLANEKGFDIPIIHAEAAARFWMGSQAGDGSWDYQIVPGNRNGSQHVSLVSAGAGSLYMLGDILNVNPPKKNRVRSDGDSDFELPGFVERLTERELEELQNNRNKEPEEPRGTVSLDAFNAAKARANGWFARNFTADTFHWPYYALYGFERYASFREKIDGELTEIPDWYDQGIEFIKQTQTSGGGFPGRPDANEGVQTALAVLFMVRSTQRLTALSRETKLDAGVLATGNLSMRGNKIISEADRKGLDELLSSIKSTMTPAELQDIAESFRNVAVSSIKDQSKAQQLTLLRDMVTNQYAEIRLVAVRALGQARMVDNCPALIFALTDPDPNIVQEANIALKFVSRKIDAPPVPEAKWVNGRWNTDSQEYKQDIRRLYKFWADWYLGLKPDAELLEVGSVFGDR